MVKYNNDRLDEVFAALADPTRRAILGQLRSGGERAVSEIAAPFRMSLPAVTKHLNVLEAAGLLVRRKSGRTVNCRLHPEPMKEAMRWLERYEIFWNERLAALGRHLETKTKGETWPTASRQALPSSDGSRRRSKPSTKPGPTRRN